ncbi:MAG: 6-pyruvoyl tetrahydrobiopterin synthase [Ignavibacteriales bacterium CG12_big_fil_rev_8_21_14_0_65_30_8]|nr:MAG: 6-pyruvoyl tetrahydrobiopterin synthase [Ignavibacteriales bacterium CG12_big_fil_rev_8_21_14_0_65_30_8]
MVYVTRRETFNAAHRLFNPKYTDEENLKIFGKCSNPNWHGHNYVLEVVVKGEVDKDTGFVINQKELKRIMREQVIEKMDHKNLNIETDFMKGVIPTSENIVIAIWAQLVNEIKNGVLYSVKLYETENNYFEYRG